MFGAMAQGVRPLHALLIVLAASSLNRGSDFIAANVPPTPGAPSTWVLEAALPLVPSVGGTVTWPINVLDDPRCRRVLSASVALHGLRVPRAEGASVRILHGSAAASLVSSLGTATRIGAPPLSHTFGSEVPSFAASGTSPTLHFSDRAPSLNLAAQRVVRASGSVHSAVPARVVDGVRDGFLSNDGVFVSAPGRSGGRPEAWVTVDLGGAVGVGSVHVYDRVVDGDGRGAAQSAVHDVRVQSLAPVPQGGFKLSLTLGGVEYVSVEVGLDAPATRQDAVAMGGPHKVSVQEALEALAPVGNVLVSRRFSAGTGAARGAFSWRVTFVGRGGLPLITLKPGSLVVRGANPGGTPPLVTTVLVRNGRGAGVAYTDSGRAVSVFQPCTVAAYAALSLDERCRDVGCGSGVDGWLILSTADLGDVPLAQALRHASVVYKARVPCPGAGSTRQHVLSLPTAVTGRYVRLQRDEEDDRPLAVAEVEVYAGVHAGTSTWRGGAELAVGAYDSDDSLTAAFFGSPAVGTWLLEFTLPPPPSPPPDTAASKADTWASTAASSMSTWTLHLTCDASRPDWNDDGDVFDEGVADAGDPFPRGGGASPTAYDPSAAPVTRSFEAGVTVTVHSWPRHGRITPAPRLTAAYEGAYPRLPSWLSSAAPAPAAAGRRAVNEAPFAQCPDGARLRLNADGSQTACDRGLFAPKPRVPTSASDGSTIPADAVGDRFLELDFVVDGHRVAFDPFAQWGRARSLSSSLLPLEGESEEGGHASGSEGTDEVLYSARRSDQVHPPRVHRLRLQAARRS